MPGPAVVFCPPDGIFQIFRFFQNLVRRHIPPKISGPLPGAVPRFRILPDPVIVHPFHQCAELFFRFCHTETPPFSGSSPVLFFLFLLYPGIQLPFNRTILFLRQYRLSPCKILKKAPSAGQVQRAAFMPLVVRIA